ncbi:hypothetical protein P4V86_21665 [Brevibacillus laterosporus]|uniref:hypothetical protein n=1 Tax=Brevibacillus laterosporus TaxID=1465 RepID=UPI00036A55B1|nr:hypothetical protein [Brevibacillus laterosporus]ATO50014.1 hypothetical protein BrL25_13500 [Brevibacillus laterosporus DSM 25]MED2005938.1 hypothetical protein [Brevibacillus laterosporus]PPA82274.1 hypothetical protein C4A75_19400 [Brevibacillus laterosporus]
MGTGIFEETSVNELGTMQGGILSPLLANEYLDIFDQWVAYQWIEKPTKYIYTRQSNKLASLRRTKILKNKISATANLYRSDILIGETGVVEDCITFLRRHPTEILPGLVVKGISKVMIEAILIGSSILLIGVLTGQHTLSRRMKQ